jgi:hypothetical protein
MKFKWIPLGFLTVLAVSSLGFRSNHRPDPEDRSIWATRPGS